MGLIDAKWDLEKCDGVTASSFCRRRLPIVMVRLRMSQNAKMATQLIQQGHVRVGAEVIKDPAFLVTRLVFTRSLNVFVLKVYSARISYWANTWEVKFFALSKSTLSTDLTGWVWILSDSLPIGPLKEGLSQTQFDNQNLLTMIAYSEEAEYMSQKLFVYFFMKCFLMF